MRGLIFRAWDKAEKKMKERLEKKRLPEIIKILSGLEVLNNVMGKMWAFGDVVLR